MEPGESARDTALREVREEGGVEVRIFEKVDTIKIFFYWPPKDKLKPEEKQERIFKVITLFLMEMISLTDKGPDQEEVAETTWLPFDQAMEKLTFGNEKDILKKARELVK